MYHIAYNIYTIRVTHLSRVRMLRSYLCRQGAGERRWGTVRESLFDIINQIHGAGTSGGATDWPECQTATSQEEDTTN